MSASLPRGVQQITMPMPFALRHVHAYAIETDDGWVLVDAGFPSTEALAIFERELTSIVGGLDAIKAVVVTHFHPDHSGLAGWLQERSDAEVYVHRLDWERLAEMRAEEEGSAEAEDGVDTRRWGRERSLREMFRRDMEEIDLPQPSPTLVEGDSELSIGGRDFRLIWTPGHTPGHLCVLEEASGVLYSGDHILGRITPHIGMWAADGSSPLHEFEGSLQKVAELAPSVVLPAHEAIVEQPKQRITELLDHHEERREETIKAIQGGAASVEQIAEQVFAKRWDNAMQRAFAISETLAHLEALVKEGALVSSGVDIDAEYAIAGS